MSGKTGRPRQARPTLEGITHGTRRGYNLGCGCDPCRASNSVAQKAWRDKNKERV